MWCADDDRGVAHAPLPSCFIRLLVVGGWDRGWVVWLISCLGEMGYVCRIGGCVDLGHYYESRTVLCIHKAIPLYSISM